MEYRPFSGLSLSPLGMGDMRLPAVPGQEEKIDEGKTRLLKWRKTTQTGSTPAVFVWALALTSALLVSGCSSLAKAKEDTETPSDALVIAEQGNFSAGGTVISSDGEFDPKVPWFVPQGGQTRHGDHADVFYQIPAAANKYAMVFLHGYGQSRRSWQMTADGREGFSTIFFGKATASTSLTNRGAGKPDRPRFRRRLTPLPMTKHGLRSSGLACGPNITKVCNFPVTRSR